jgi:hypothetical protein
LLTDLARDGEEFIDGLPGKVDRWKPFRFTLVSIRINFNGVNVASRLIVVPAPHVRFDVPKDDPSESVHERGIVGEESTMHPVDGFTFRLDHRNGNISDGYLADLRVPSSYGGDQMT